jgi:hypothetical protein
MGNRIIFSTDKCACGHPAIQHKIRMAKGRPRVVGCKACACTRFEFAKKPEPKAEAQS